jgi:hypothetical protein
VLFLWLRSLRVFGPGWYHANEARVGDRLSQVLRRVTDNEEQYATLGIFPAKPVKALFQVGIRHRSYGLFCVNERVLHGGDDLCFVDSGFFQIPYVHTTGRRGSYEFVQVVIGATNVQEHFRKRPNIRRGTPIELVGRNGFGEPGQFIFLDHDFGQHFRPVPGYTGSTVLVRIHLR